MRIGCFSILVLAVVIAPLAAQVAAPAEPAPSRTGPPPAAQSSVPQPGNVLPLLPQLEQTATALNGDIGGLRINKWKADSTTKQQAEQNAQSIQRNLTSALPAIIGGVRTAPDNVAASFKLYRNVNALYDVLSSLAESAGAFGPKDQYETLATDASKLDQIRLQMADQIDKLAAFKDAEVDRLMVQVRNLAAEAAAKPPTKIIVDDNEPPEKPAPRKRKAAVKPKAAPPAAPTQSPQSPPPKQ